jgi:ketosteroid isomerase-like protein
MPKQDPERVLGVLEGCLRSVSDEIVRDGTQIKFSGLGPSPRAVNRRDTTVIHVDAQDGVTILHADVRFQASAFLGASSQDAVVQAKLERIFEEMRSHLGVDSWLSAGAEKTAPVPETAQASEPEGETAAIAEPVMEPIAEPVAAPITETVGAETETPENLAGESPAEIVVPEGIRAVPEAVPVELTEVTDSPAAVAESAVADAQSPEESRADVLNSEPATLAEPDSSASVAERDSAPVSTSEPASEPEAGGEIEPAPAVHEAAVTERVEATELEAVSAPVETKDSPEETASSSSDGSPPKEAENAALPVEGAAAEPELVGRAPEPDAALAAASVAARAASNGPSAAANEPSAASVDSLVKSDSKKIEAPEIAPPQKREVLVPAAKAVSARPADSGVERRIDGPAGERPKTSTPVGPSGWKPSGLLAEDGAFEQEQEKTSRHLRWSAWAAAVIVLVLAPAAWLYLPSHIPRGTSTADGTAAAGAAPAAAPETPAPTEVPQAVANIPGEDSDPAVVIQDWESATNATDASTQAAFYADPVERYFLRHNVSRDQVKADKQASIDKRKDGWSVKMEQVKVTRSGNRPARIRLIKHFKVRENGRLASEWFVPSVLEMTRTNGKWQITSERDLGWGTSLDDLEY